MSFIFGPVNSRRFGLSLGINVFNKEKICNFDCLYCELKPSSFGQKTKITNPQIIFKDVQKALKNHPNIDVLTITANGEPTLYPFLDELIDLLKPLNKKLLILSNSSMLYKQKIKNTLKKLDIVKLSLDCATKKCFSKLDKPLHSNIKSIINSIEEFRKIYSGSLVIEILVVSKINDKKKEFLKLKNALLKIKPDRIDLGTIDRPPAYDVKNVSYKKLLKLYPFLQVVLWMQLDK
jgi:wyosine [tRNA(Phe)-imidazoG37] synthetase (radical SAM superfamily)